MNEPRSMRLGARVARAFNRSRKPVLEQLDDRALKDIGLCRSDLLRIQTTRKQGGAPEQD